MKIIKTILVGLIITSTLISCGDNCEQKALEKFQQEQSKIDKLEIGVSTIKSTYINESYDDVKTLVRNYYNDYEGKNLILKLTDEQIISMKDEIIRVGEIDLEIAKSDLVSMKEDFIRICKQ